MADINLGPMKLEASVQRLQGDVEQMNAVPRS